MCKTRWFLDSYIRDCANGAQSDDDDDDDVGVPFSDENTTAAVVHGNAIAVLPADDDMWNVRAWPASPLLSHLPVETRFSLRTTSKRILIAIPKIIKSRDSATGGDWKMCFLNKVRDYSKITTRCVPPQTCCEVTRQKLIAAFSETISENAVEQNEGIVMANCHATTDQSCQTVIALWLKREEAGEDSCWFSLDDNGDTKMQRPSAMFVDGGGRIASAFIILATDTRILFAKIKDGDMELVLSFGGEEWFIITR